MSKKKMSPVEQDSKMKVSRNSSSQAHSETGAEDKKGLNPTEPPKADREKPKCVSEDEWVYEEPVR
jgi:hypothetical protein